MYFPILIIWLTFFKTSESVFLVGYSWRDFNNEGIVAAIGYINTTMDKSSFTVNVTTSQNFTIQSSEFTCNVAQRLRVSNNELSSYVVPEEYFVTEYDRLGNKLSSEIASKKFDMTAIAIAKDGWSYSLATVPPLGIGIPVFLIRLNSTSGEVQQLGEALPNILDVNQCTSAVSTDGLFVYFLNNKQHVNPFHRMQEVVVIDTKLLKVSNTILYQEGIISSLVGWKNVSSGKDLLLAFIWPATGGSASIVSFDPFEENWAPTLIWAFDPSILPMPDCLAVHNDTLFGLVMGSDCPPNCMQDVQLLTVLNLSSNNASLTITKVFVSPTLSDVFPTGLYQCAIVTAI